MNQLPTPMSLSEEEQRRVNAIHQLSRAGPAAIAALIEQLADPSWPVRRWVVAALASMGDAAVGPLSEVVRRERRDEARLAAAIDALVDSKGQVEEELLALAEAEDPAVVADAAQIIGRRRSGSLVPRLVELALHPDDNVAVAAIEALGRVGGRAAVDTLIASVQSGSFFRAFPAIDVLGRSGDPRSIEPLAELLNDNRYAFEATRALGRTGDKHAVAPLAEILCRSGGALARVAALAIAELEDRYAERYGDSDLVSDAVRQAISPRATVRCLAFALPNADSAEKAAVARVLGAAGSDAVPVLTSLLDESPAVTAAAAAALKRIGREGEEEVLDALTSGNSERRRVLLPLVSARAKTIDAIVACLDDPDPQVQVLAAEALGRTGNPASVPHLFRQLDSANAVVTHAVVSAVQTLGGPETRRLALDAARSGLVEVRRAAVRILSYFGYPESVEVLLEAMEDPDEWVRSAAVFGLPFVEDPRARDALLGGAGHPAARTRAATMRALGQVSSGDLRATSALLRGLTDEDGWVRYYACQALGRAGFEPAAGLIASLLRDEAGQVRVAAVEALSHLESQEAFESLRSAAVAEDPDVRRAALLGLGIQKRQSGLRILLEAANSPDSATRLFALSAAAGFHEPEVVPALARAARDEDPNVRNAAVGLLAGVPSAEATRQLAELVDSTSSTRVLAALALPVEGRVPGLLTALQSADDDTALILTTALARMRRPDAMAALLEALTFPKAPARKAAATTLAGIGTEEARLALRAAAEHDPDPEIRRICRAGLMT